MQWRKRIWLLLTKISRMSDTMQSVQSLAARDGFAVETVACTQVSLREALERYFGLGPITSIAKIGGNKKSDNLVTFESGEELTLQFKNGTSTGHQVDRRPLNKVPEPFRGMASQVCLATGKGREVRPEFVVDNYQVPSRHEWLALVDRLFLGEEPEYQPTHIVLTVFKDGEIVSAEIETTDDFMAAVESNAFDTVCIGKQGHTITGGPEFALQRRGGEGKKPDGSPKGNPDDLMMKVKTGKKAMENHNWVKLI